jgi:hypothetical protein
MKKVMLLGLLTGLVLPLWGCVISPYPYRTHTREYYYREHPRSYHNTYRYRPYYYRHHWDRPRYDR